LFADDTFIFCEANPNHIRCLCALFFCFEDVFDLKVNLAKLELVPVGNVHNVDGLACVLGCGVSSLPLKYLGLPLGAFCVLGLRPSVFLIYATLLIKKKKKGQVDMDGVIEKIECHLAGWKRMFFEGLL
jgi:hypothetical protein